MSRRNAGVLEAALEAGHAAIHRGYVASSKAMNSVIDIVENLLQAMYPLETMAENLCKSTPKRQRDSEAR